MAERRIVLIQGHPDPIIPHLCHALADAYAAGAADAGHAVRRIEVAGLDFPLLRSQQDWEQGSLPAALTQAQADITWAQHLVFFFPLWLGDMPALVYRWYFRAHSIKSLERNVLGFVGIAPVNETLIGMVDKLGDEGVLKWTAKLRKLGAAAD
jgi:putative NADPH-quinone reductase